MNAHAAAVLLDALERPAEMIARRIDGIAQQPLQAVPRGEDLPERAFVRDAALTVDGDALLHLDAEVARSSAAPLQRFQQFRMRGDAGAAADQFDAGALIDIGVPADLAKESGAEKIYEAIKQVYENEFFFNDLTNKALLSGLRNKTFADAHKPAEVHLNEKEITILRLMCEEKSTKEIADIVDLSPRTVEAIRDKLKTKTGTKSMAGLVMYAVKAGIVEQ